PAPASTTPAPEASPSRPFFLHEGAEPPPVQLFGGSVKNVTEPFNPADYEPPVPTVTNSGLTRRVPRKDGATRAIPGSDSERGAGATKRSPDEVRSLLSSYRAGTERARSTDPAGAPAPDDRKDQT
ncbi:MAG: hypothetical protein JWN46_491, partial [Acidimicrobiales bacterium]|nr:hypothetical protein [Acidimicrobiales bacterium]